MKLWKHTASVLEYRKSGFCPLALTKKMTLKILYCPFIKQKGHIRSLQKKKCRSGLKIKICWKHLWHNFTQTNQIHCITFCFQTDIDTNSLMRDERGKIPNLILTTIFNKNYNLGNFRHPQHERRPSGQIIWAQLKKLRPVGHRPTHDLGQLIWMVLWLFWFCEP